MESKSSLNMINNYHYVVSDSEVCQRLTLSYTAYIWYDHTAKQWFVNEEFLTIDKNFFKV